VTFLADVQARYANELLVELTNQGVRTASTANTTKIAAAIADASAEFEEETGIVPDAANASHTAAISVGAVHYLHVYTTIQSERARRFAEDWTKWLKRLASSKGNERRLLPSTSSTANPSERTAGHRPDFDREQWDAYTLGAPRGGSRSTIDPEDDDS